MALEIYSTDECRPKALTCFVYGQSRIGKTHFAATFPKPIFLCASVEGNDATLSQFKDIKIANIKNKVDMDDAIKALQIDPRLKDRKTIVIDSLTFYMDMWISEILKKKNEMTIRDWQMLDLHIMKYMVPTLHSLGKHVVWISLEQELRRGDAVIGCTPMLYGKAPQKVPATTDLIIHLTQKTIRGSDNKPRRARIAELKSDDATPIGGRYGLDMPEDYIEEPSFIKIAQKIGKRIGEEVPMAK